MAELTMVEALNKALDDNMAADDRVCVMGEDVGVDGGVFRVTKGLIEKYGEERVIDTPLAECGLRDPEHWRLVLLRRAELDGAEGDELLAGYESTDGERRRAYDVIRWR